jgi:hypothetical protein
MTRSFARLVRPVAVAAVMVWMSGCSHRVTIPPSPDQDSKPTISISSFPVDGGLTVNPEIVTTGGTYVQVVPGTKVMILVGAKNGNGVQSLWVRFKHGSSVTEATVTASPDASGQVPTTLEILGTNGAGGAGTQPIVLQDSPAQGPVPLPASIEVKAISFTGLTEEYSVNYLPWWRGATIKSFEASRTYVNIGDPVEFSWTIIGTHAFTKIALEGLDADGAVEGRTGLAAGGTFTAYPMRRTLTKYKLTVSDIHNGTLATREIDVTITNSKFVQGQVFYFKMSNPQSVVTPCFTLALFAPDVATAEQLAKSRNGNYAAMEISAQEYFDGCQ